MQTSFSLAQLADPRIAEADSILRSCVHCGFCTATCPSYLLTGDELDSPRGRIYLIKDMLEQDRAATHDVAKHIDRCLSCLSCMTTCPASVNYMHLVDHARDHIERTYRRPLADRFFRAFLAHVLPYPGRFRLAAFAGFLAKPFGSAFRAIPFLKPLAAMIALAPSTPPNRSSFEGPAVFHSPFGGKQRVALLSGCAHPVLRPDLNEATIRLLTRHGVDVVLPAGEGCCGALPHHLGKSGAAHDMAKANIDAWMRELESEGLDAIIINASGCGTNVKDYGYMFRNDPDYRDKARIVSGIARDITEYVDGLTLQHAPMNIDVDVAYHSACSMQHGQQIKSLPKTLLNQAGFRVKDVPEGHICCGSAGTYNMLQADFADRLRARKVANIEGLNPDVIATGNLGCMTQIGAGTKLPIVHTVELLDWATGGPCPAALKHLNLAASGRDTDMQLGEIE
ncbi:MAG: glycolate oxidase subunit GlcF [Fimbriimonadaceae bacterium]|nr:glycolate oxidase subunit GlcF [Alphaproteobacteria bacterium]